MRIAAADWLPYRLPFRRPWASAGGMLPERRGRLLRLRTDDGRTAWGDCAPFPEIGILPPAAQAHAEECALLDLAAQAAGLPLAAWLLGRRPPTSIAVNAALGDIHALTPETTEAALAAGHRVLKVKVGLGDPAEELSRLTEVSASLPPGATLRLDANRAWPEATAARFLEACAGLPVEAVEEPLQSPDAAALSRLQARLPFPLALDESIRLATPAFLAQPPVRRLILKPPRHGGLLPTLRLALAARNAGLECIVTSSLESACGLAAATHLAAVIAPDGVHGLATASWFAEDTGIAPPLREGRLFLPDAPGIGFSPGIS